MTDRHHSLLGVGVYTVPEAARLTGIPAPTIRRWVTGYTYTRNGIAHRSPPLWEGQIAPAENSVALGFRDLLEVRFIDFFRNQGVGWKAIKLAADCASDIIHDSHPFSTKRFKTDGRSIFAEIVQATGEESLLDLSKRQYEFKSFVEPYLFQGLEFSDIGIAPVRWWPLGKNRRVTIDPDRAFGQPICTPESVPTVILANAYEAEKSVDAVARWFMVHPRSVLDAVEFENKLSVAA
jgi:uncharacterized protein (DUF433 family)